MDFAAYITGFADGEGSFSISFNSRSKLRTGIEIRPSFAIAQNASSLKSLEQIRDYFKCGSIRYSIKDNTYKYEVRSITDLTQVIIPHFIKYPLQTAKSNDFNTFRIICEMIANKDHQQVDNLDNIIDLAITMNPSGKRKYTKDKLLQFVTR